MGTFACMCLVQVFVCVCTCVAHAYVGAPMHTCVLCMCVLCVHACVWLQDGNWRCKLAYKLEETAINFYQHHVREAYVF